MHTYDSYSRVCLIVSIVGLVVIGQCAVCQGMFGETPNPVSPEHPVINEFMAMNSSDTPLGPGEFVDEDNESSDWIEIYNPTDQPIDLSGWPKFGRQKSFSFPSYEPKGALK
jgi:hypothetical protein